MQITFVDILIIQNKSNPKCCFLFMNFIKRTYTTLKDITKKYEQRSLVEVKSS